MIWYHFINTFFLKSLIHTSIQPKAEGFNSETPTQMNFIFERPTQMNLQAQESVVKLKQLTKSS